MSTDAEGTQRPRASAERRLRRRFVAVVGVLVVVGALAAVVGSTQGPRLRDVTYSASDLVSKPAQRVILTANQTVEGVTAADVRVSPAAAHTVTSSGNAIAVEFTGPLAYDRRYRITVDGVRAPGQAATSTLTTSVHTGTTDVLALRHGTGSTPDRIVRRSLGGAGDRVVVAATGIADFAEVGRSVVVVRDVAGGNSAIDLVALDGSGVASTTVPVERIALPTASGHVSALHAAADGASFGFVYADTVTGRSEDVGLYVVDLTGTHMPTPVDGSGAQRSGAVPMTVSQWAYVPRSESALVRTADDELFLVDMSGRRPAVRLGSAAYLHGFVGSGTTAVVETGSGIDSLDLTDGRTSPLPTPAAASDGAFRGRVAAITDQTYLRVVGDFRDDGSIAARLVRVDGPDARTLALRLPADGSVTAVCPSPNGEFVAVATRTASSSLVSIVDARSGALEASLDGTTVDWCSALPSGDDVG
ncbi:hypothetical protein [Curtobacterium sp. Leaf261]|uniref:hypothetical protein n=1 Tax=Curtobacterium sp. Leaf261 TaxID=1736311 RepID=UPI0006F41920|nr:hypothetical protein [Curtobacterium sp. Leaf261]KQO60017.1 hypothetical protein ASF23_15320 [Curtobacterium sp. Leaf261]